MAGFTFDSNVGQLSISSVNMMCPAWVVDNLIELYFPAQQRGGDRLIPGANGILPYKRRPTATVRSLRMYIRGDCDRTGTPTANLYVGLQTNLDYLNNNVVVPTGTGDGTRSATLTLSGGGTRVEPIHVLGMEIGEFAKNSAYCTAVISISIPSGRFT